MLSFRTFHIAAVTWVAGLLSASLVLAEVAPSWRDPSPCDPGSASEGGANLQDLRGRANQMRQMFAAGGYSGNGGGPGMACFRTLEQARNARDRQGRLLQHARTQFQEIWTLDFWEMGRNRDFVEPLASHRDDRDYLNWILETQWGACAPHFVERIQQALRQLDEGPWTDRKDLSLVPDLGGGDIGAPIRDGDRWCVPVPLVRRQQTVQHGSRSQLSLEGDRELISRLGELNQPGSRFANQAMLRLHEAIYVIAQDLGHEDSVRVRELVRRLLSRSTNERIAGLGCSGRSTFLRASLETLRMLNHDRLYSVENKSLPPPLGGGRYTKDTRQRSQASAQQKMRTAITRWLNGRDPIAVLGNPEQRVAMGRFIIRELLGAPDQLTDEEAFTLTLETINQLQIPDAQGRPIQDAMRAVTSGMDDRETLRRTCGAIAVEVEQHRTGRAGGRNSWVLSAERSLVYLNRIDVYCREIGAR